MHHMTTLALRTSSRIATAPSRRAARRRDRRAPADRRRVLPRWARTMRRPSGEQTIACRSISLALIVARAPSGSWQPPPSADTTRRSASSAANDAGVVDRPQRAPALLVAGADFDRDDALARRRHALSRRNHRRDAVAEAKPAQAGGGEHQRVVFSRIELAQPRVDVAANRREARRRERPATAGRCA